MAVGMRSVAACIALLAVGCGSGDDTSGNGDTSSASGGGANASGGGANASGGGANTATGGGTSGSTGGDGTGVTTVDGCNINSGYAGDENCILPPPETEGFQLHYGPTDYDNPDEVAQYLVQPGLDAVGYYPMTSGNTQDVYFYKRQYRMRPGSHHLILSEASGTGAIFGSGRRLGGSQNQVKDNPQGEIPPENVGIGMPLSANAALTLNLHYFNGTDQPILEEAWVNVWYVDASTVTQEAKEMFLWVQGSSVAPGQTAVFTGNQAISEAGRVLTMYGHRHSNNVRFSAWRVRGTETTLAYEDYNWEEPAVYEFNSLTTNPVADPVAKTPGGYTGILDLQPGDTLRWECEIQNNRDVTITFGENEAATSEMCILVGDAIGPQLISFSL